MSEQFDEDAFLRRLRGIIIHSKGKTFAQLTGEIDALRQETEQVRDKSARRFIDRQLDRQLFIFAVDAGQPPRFIDRLYRRRVRRGFTDLHEEVYAAIEYAYYWNEQNKSDKGLRALYVARETVAALELLPADIMQNFLEAIDQPIRQLENKR